MIELEFMTGNEPHMPFPPYVKAAGLTQRFTVLQENTYDVRVPDTTFDEAVWRTLIAFITGYDASAHISIAEREQDADKVLRAEDMPAPAREPRWKSAVPWALIAVGAAIYLAIRWFHLFGA